MPQVTVEMEGLVSLVGGIKEIGGRGGREKRGNFLCWVGKPLGTLRTVIRGSKKEGVMGGGVKKEDGQKSISRGSSVRK